TTSAAWSKGNSSKTGTTAKSVLAKNGHTPSPATSKKPTSSSCSSVPTSSPQPIARKPKCPLPSRNTKQAPPVSSPSSFAKSVGSAPPSANSKLSLPMVNL